MGLSIYIEIYIFICKSLSSGKCANLQKQSTARHTKKKSDVIRNVITRTVTQRDNIISEYIQYHTNTFNIFSHYHTLRIHKLYYLCVCVCVGCWLCVQITKHESKIVCCLFLHLISHTSLSVFHSLILHSYLCAKKFTCGDINLWNTVLFF